MKMKNGMKNEKMKNGMKNEKRNKKWNEKSK